jgi:alpha-L-fucosidase 2
VIARKEGHLQLRRAIPADGLMRNILLWQRYSSEIAFLLALPLAWPEGRFRGLRARGVEVDVSWKRSQGGSGTLRPSRRRTLSRRNSVMERIHV